MMRWKSPYRSTERTRAVISLPADVAKEEAISAGKEAVADRLKRNRSKRIYVPGRIINLVVKG